MSEIPAPYQPTGTEARVCADIAKRQQLGIAKYGTTVAGNPLPLREWLRHAYEETLDQAIYLRRALEEMEAAAEPVDECHICGIREDCWTCVRCEEHVCTSCSENDPVNSCQVICEDCMDET